MNQEKYIGMDVHDATISALSASGSKSVLLFMLAAQDHSSVIMLGKWWHVLLVLIALVGIVWLILKISDRKQPRS